jgi:hypothetical protein
MYLSGIASFHLGRLEDAYEQFRELEREADRVSGRRRVIRSYLASQADGHPRVFHGTVAWVDEERNRGELYVEELRRNVRFFPLDFNRPGIQAREAIGRFHIAFNFLGPIADPIAFAGVRRDTHD